MAAGDRAQLLRRAELPEVRGQDATGAAPGGVNLDDFSSVFEDFHGFFMLR